MTVTSNAWLYGVTIEGLGLADGTRQYRWVWRRDDLDDAATADPDSVYLDGLLRWPSEIGVEVDFLAGRASVGQQTLTLAGSESGIWPLLCAARVSRVTRLATPAISATDATIVLDDAGHGGTVVYLEREAIYLDVDAGGGTYTSCDRGILGTEARPHGVDPEDDTEVFTTMHPSTRVGRTVRLIRIPHDSTGYSDEETVWTGVLRRVHRPQPDTVSIEAVSAHEWIRGRLLGDKLWRSTVHGVAIDNDGVLRNVNVVPTDNRPASGHSSDYRSVYRVGDSAYVATYLAETRYFHGVHPGLDPVPFTRWGHVPDASSAPKSGDPLWEILSSADGAPSNSASPAANTLPLSQEPATLLLQLLLSTDNGGTPGPNHATYDTGVAQIAGAVPAALLDVTGIEAWGQRWAGVRLDAFHLFVDGERESLGDAASRILRIFGAVLGVGRDGLITVHQLSDVPLYGATVTNITQDDLVGAPRWGESQQGRLPSVDGSEYGAVDTILVEYDARVDGGRAATVEAIDEIVRHRTMRTSDRLQIDAGAISSLDEVAAVAVSAVARLHDPIPVVEFDTTRLTDLWPGDVVTMDHDLLLDPAGARPMSGERLLITGRRESLRAEGHVLSYKALDVGAIYDNDPVHIAPSAQVASWSSPNLTVEANVYTDTTGQIVLDADGFAAGDRVQLCDQYGTIRVAKVGVDAVSGSILTLDTGDLGATVPAAGDIIRVASYTDSAAAQQDAWVYIEESGGGLDGDLAKEYGYR